MPNYLTCFSQSCKQIQMNLAVVCASVINPTAILCHLSYSKKIYAGVYDKANIDRFSVLRVKSPLIFTWSFCCSCFFCLFSWLFQNQYNYKCIDFKILLPLL